MLKDLDLGKSIGKKEFKEQIEGLELRLAELQRMAREACIPVIILFEGWEASGKGTLINELIQPLDPRGFNVHSIHDPTEEESFRPFMWRFWIRTPERGRITIFDRSWYSATVKEFGQGHLSRSGFFSQLEAINDFESELIQDGTLIIKFFLHISQKEQKKRFKKLESDPASAWRVTTSDWYENAHYDGFLDTIQMVYEATDTDIAPWSIIEAEDRRFAQLKIFMTVIDRLEDYLEDLHHRPQNGSVHPATSGSAESHVVNTAVKSSILDHVDLSPVISDEDYDNAMKAMQAKIRSHEYRIYLERIPVVILFEGWDAAGKGGAIKRLTSNLDPRGYEVIPVGAPSDIERAHHYLWRFWTKLPKAGHIGIFDRSWYGRVLVERVEGFSTPAEWKRAYQEINAMEKQLHDYGSVLLKFWLHVDRDEQLRRFEARQINPDKQWKITEEDWRNHEKWDAYWDAVDEMLLRTSTSYAPWTIVEANDKRYARVKVLKTVVNALEKRMD